MNIKGSSKLTYFAICTLGLIVLTVSIFVIKRIYFNNSIIAPQQVNIEYWGLLESEEVMKVMIAKYEKEHPNVHIHYVQKNFDNDLDTYKKTLYHRISDGIGPAIFRIHSTWTPAYYSLLSKSNTSMDAAEFTNRFYDVAKRPCVDASGQVVCIPLMYDGLVLLYNEDMFRDAGIFNPNIQSWEDFRSIAIKLTQYDQGGKIKRSGAAIGTTNNVTNFSDIITLMLYQTGLNIPDNLDDPKIYTVFNFYKGFASQDHIWDEDYPNSLDSFASQQTAMVFAKSNQILRILDLNPTLNFIAVPVPQLPKIGGTTTNEYIASQWVEGVSAGVPKNVQEESWKFLTWMSLPQQEIDRFNSASVYKKFGEPYSNKNLKNNLINSPLLGPIIKFAPDARSSAFVDDSGNSEYKQLLINNIENPQGVAGSGVFDDKFKKQYQALQSAGIR